MSGASPTGRAGGLRPEPVAQSQPKALIPDARMQAAMNALDAVMDKPYLNRKEHLKKCVSAVIDGYKSAPKQNLDCRALRDAIYDGLTDQWQPLSALNLGDMRGLWGLAKTLGSLVESKYDQRLGRLVWRRTPAPEAPHSHGETQ